MEMDRHLQDLSVIVEDFRRGKREQTKPPSTAPVGAKTWQALGGVVSASEEHKREEKQAELPTATFVKASRRNPARRDSSQQDYEEDSSPFAAFLKAKKEAMCMGATPLDDMQTPGPRTVTGCS